MCVLACTSYKNVMDRAHWQRKRLFGLAGCRKITSLFFVWIVCAVALATWRQQWLPRWYVHVSELHGKGVFAARTYLPGDRIHAILQPTENGSVERTPEFGMFINHCTRSPSAKIVDLRLAVYGRDHVWVAATRVIRIGEEITIDYSTPEARSWFPLPMISVSPC